MSRWIVRGYTERLRGETVVSQSTLRSQPHFELPPCGNTFTDSVSVLFFLLCRSTSNSHSRPEGGFAHSSKMSRRRLQVGVLSVCLATATAIGNDCTGASATLPPEECSAWIALYVSTGGPVWKSCSELRTNPCACPVVMCNGDPARPHIAELYVFLRCTSSLSDHDPSLFRAALRALTRHYLRHYQHAFSLPLSLSLSLRAHAATCATTT
jgi:hypothetical protein